jgi:kynurenine formamidase
VVLDFRKKRAGEEILIDDLKAGLESIGYTLKPFDIVLVMTGASKQYIQPDYMNLHAGMTRESTLWLIDRGIRVMGVDAWVWDRPFKVMAEELNQGIKGDLGRPHRRKGKGILSP